jgi:hypothetical protein
MLSGERFDAKGQGVDLGRVKTAVLGRDLGRLEAIDFSES